MLGLLDIHKAFAGQPVVRGVTLAAERGRTVCLIGPSGCGKSTLLRIAVGLVAPDRGRMELDGRPIDADGWRAARLRIGYVIQEGGLFPHLTAAGNAMLAARHVGWSLERCRARVSAVAEVCRFDPGLLDRHPGQLSGGQRQRVALMRALMLDPEVLLLDEPLGALDPIVRFELQEELKQLFDALDKAVVLVTHDLAEAAYLAHHLVLVRAGEVVQEGSPREVLDTPQGEFAERFVRAQRGHALGSA